MLSMKTVYSPLALLFNSSHEQLNPWHRLSGRVIYSLLCCHATWYLNFFVQKRVLGKRLRDLDVLIGITAFSMMNIIVSTSLERVRRWSYRVFFVLHLTIGITILPLLFFHAKPLRLYIIQSLALFIFDLGCRKLDTVTGFATITKVPNTKLIKVKIPVPLSKLRRFQAAPGQHVYLSIPPQSTPLHTSNPSIYDLLFNPFTVAEVSAIDVTLILRVLNGPTTTALDVLTHLPKAKAPINIEGPLGSSSRFPNLAADFDRILLVAGGVGATFIFPIYQNLREQLENESKSADRVTLTWSMRSAAEATWAVGSEMGGKLEEDENVKIFLTRSSADDREHNDDLITADASVELDELQWIEEPIKATGGRERPDLRKIVDGIFRCGNEERVAVLVCGPAEMARDLRGHVGRWVEKGRNVWFHNESFGW
jgi:NAD(P)H-flavin reductase